MKKKSSSKRIKLKIDSTEETLFKNLTDQELKEIKGGCNGFVGTLSADFPGRSAHE